MVIRTLKARLPWWAKMTGRVLMTRLPISYGFWHHLGIFQHGCMEDPSYAYAVFTQHFDRAKFARRSNGFVALELGPGDSLCSAIIARAYGATSCYLVDAGKFAQENVQLYKNMAAFLSQKGLSAPNLNRLLTLEEVLATCHATYATAGIASLKQIPTASVDFIWSHAVLQSIRQAEFAEAIHELRRILRDDGSSSHQVSMQDPFVGALNHLRFSESAWESNLMARSEAYRNRLRYSEMLSVFQSAGFNVDIVKVNRWEQLPTPKQKLARQFQVMSDEELKISSFGAVLTPM